MNRQTLLIAALILVNAVYFQVYGQVVTPQPSPTATLSQKVGLTDISITYSRPGVKDRKIFGDLVPYGSVWRTGANSATKITFSDDVKIGGKDLKAGTYGLFTIPGEETWTIILNTNSQQWGSYQYKEDEDVLRVQVKPETLAEKFETFLINIDNVRNTSATIDLIWENTRVAVPLTVEIDAKIMASIDKSLEVSADNYAAAASYFQQTEGKDLNQALEWINKALEKYEAQGRNVFWIYRTKAMIQAGLGKKKDAIETAKVSIEKAKEANNSEYVKFNEASIKEWSK